MKKRIPSIHIDVREDVQINWNPKEQCLELINPEGLVSDKHLVSVGQAYERKGKHPKILRQLKNPTGGKIKILPIIPGLDRYMAIDTSFVPFGENDICATGCLLIDQPLDKSGRISIGTSLRICMPPRLIFLAKKGSKPERYGWMRMIESYFKSELHNQQLTYGVIVDSDINDLRKIEENEESILSNFVLPDNFSMIYASADSGKENMLNKLIAMTDRVAAQSLKIAIEKFKSYENHVLIKAFKEIEIQKDGIALPE